MKIALCIGHGLKTFRRSEVYDPGAAWHGVEEYRACREIAAMIVDLCAPILGLEVSCMPVGTPQQRVRDVNDLDPEYAVELHLNASRDESVRGCECLFFPGSERGEELAVHFASYLSEVLHTRNRGVRAREDLYFLRATRCPAIITEAEFVSHPDVAWGISEGFMRQCIAFAHARAIANLVWEGSE